jgi:hypothetical protein
MYWLETPALNVNVPLPIFISAFATCENKSTEAKVESAIFLILKDLISNISNVLLA